MARGPRNIAGIKRAVVFQQARWRKNRQLALSRANVSGFGSMVGVFFAVVFACFAFISHQPWFIFCGLSIASLVFSWQAILSAERHLASVPVAWALKAVPPFSLRVTHQVAASATLPETPHMLIDRTLGKFAQLSVAAQVVTPRPARAALDDLIKIAEDSVMSALCDAPRVDKTLRAARARPKDLKLEVMARSMRHRFQLPAISIEGVTADLLAALSGGSGPDVPAIQEVGRKLAELLRTPPPPSQAELDKRAAEDAAAALVVEAVASGPEHRTLSGDTAMPQAPALDAGLAAQAAAEADRV